MVNMKDFPPLLVHYPHGMEEASHGTYVDVYSIYTWLIESADNGATLPDICKAIAGHKDLMI